MTLKISTLHTRFWLLFRLPIILSKLTIILYVIGYSLDSNTSLDEEEYFNPIENIQSGQIGSGITLVFKVILNTIK